MHGIEAQEVRIGFDRSEIVDGKDFEILAPRFDRRTQNIAADAAEPVDGDANRHSESPYGLSKRANAASATFSGVIPKCW